MPRERVPLRRGQAIYRQRVMRAQIADGVVSAVAEANSRTAKSVVALAEVMSKGVAREQLTRAHRTMGLAAQESILKSYDANVTAKKTNPNPYRRDDEGINRRYAGGALRDALGRSDMVKANARGVSIINVRVLDIEAPHWARLNAGAGARGKGSRREYEIRFSNLVVGTIGARMKPRPSFKIPHGVWVREGQGEAPGDFDWSPDDGPQIGRDSFYPVRPRGRRGRRGKQVFYPTRGIEARNFLDAGFATIADRMGPVYNEMLQGLWEEGLMAARPRRFTSNVRTIRNY